MWLSGRYSVAAASARFQKQSPAGASRWGTVFEYFVQMTGIERVDGTDAWVSKEFEMRGSEPASDSAPLGVLSLRVG